MPKNGSFAIILNEKKQVLLCMRDDIPLWNLPGGGVEDGESFKEALRREVREEIDVDIEIVRQTGTYKKKDGTTVKAYLCKIANGTPKMGNEGTFIEYFDLDSLPKNMSKKQRERILHARDKNQCVECSQISVCSKEIIEALDRKDIYRLDDWLNHPRVKESSKTDLL